MHVVALGNEGEMWSLMHKFRAMKTHFRYQKAQTDQKHYCNPILKHTLSTRQDIFESNHYYSQQWHQYFLTGDTFKKWQFGLRILSIFKYKHYNKTCQAFYTNCIQLCTHNNAYEGSNVRKTSLSTNKYNTENGGISNCQIICKKALWQWHCPTLKRQDSFKSLNLRTFQRVTFSLIIFSWQKSCDHGHKSK